MNFCRKKREKKFELKKIECKSLTITKTFVGGTARNTEI